MRTEDDFETVKGLIQQASLIFEIIKKKKLCLFLLVLLVVLRRLATLDRSI